MVLRHGQWSPNAGGTPTARHAASALLAEQGFTSTALGFAVAEGLIDLDATVLSYFPEYDAQITDQRSRATKVRHVASMASGHADETVRRLPARRRRSRLACS